MLKFKLKENKFMFHLSFYIVSVAIFLTLGFYTSSYWIVATILLSIYAIFVTTIYFTTKESPGREIELSSIPHHNHPDNKIGLPLHHESILEEHEVRFEF